jgi:hypothetical protein
MWARRYREEGEAGIEDCSSRPKTSANRTPDQASRRPALRCSFLESVVLAVDLDLVLCGHLFDVRG